MLTFFVCPAVLASAPDQEPTTCGHQQFGLIHDSTGHTFLRCAQCGDDTPLGSALQSLNLQVQFAPASHPH
jgi:hypothetical protein